MLCPAARAFVSAVKGCTSKACARREGLCAVPSPPPPGPVHVSSQPEAGGRVTLPDRPQLPNVAHPRLGTWAHICSGSERDPSAAAPQSQLGAGADILCFFTADRPGGTCRGRGGCRDPGSAPRGLSTWISSSLLYASPPPHPRPSSQIDLEIPFPTSRVGPTPRVPLLCSSS